jgi:Ca-activated chloride channel family protein
MFFVLGLTLLLFGLARPEMLVDLPRIEGTVILAFDVSNSMAADDLEPTRIEAAKAAARAFVENQPPTILIGVVAFSNGGLVVQQPTNDQAAVLATIDRLSPQGGTSLGQGIFTSLNAIAGEAIAIDPSALEEDIQSIDVGHYPSAVVRIAGAAGCRSSGGRGRRTHLPGRHRKHRGCRPAARRLQHPQPIGRNDFAADRKGH